ncbi:MAG: hypothetical protein IT458_08480 [Planctomycetes bacterium]|nr:hypothetical protein [Planctomycetota bacterium]
MIWTTIGPMKRLMLHKLTPRLLVTIPGQQQPHLVQRISWGISMQDVAKFARYEAGARDFLQEQVTMDSMRRNAMSLVQLELWHPPG